MIDRSNLPGAVLLASALLAATITPPAAAAPCKLVLDPAATRVTFTLDATGHTVEGEAPIEESAIEFDLATGEASGAITVAARRIETGNKTRDSDMRRKVLETDRYPHIVFRPESAKGELAQEGKSRVELVGSFEIHGQGHPLELDCEVSREGERVSAETRFTVPYVEWGMKNPSFLFLRVAKEVEVAIHAVGRLAEGAAEPSSPDPGDAPPPSPAGTGRSSPRFPS